MDKTELYIKMSDCPEIQGLAPERHGCEIHGEWFVGLPSGWVLSEDGGYYYGEHMEDTKVVWLPRQDQLQEMVLTLQRTVSDFQVLLDDFYLFCFDGKGHKYSLRVTSMEQLWLAFVMKEKYNKVWNGEEWITAR